jgi:hypothetical protein
MNSVKRALAAMLVAALVLPSAAAAQQPCGRFNATPATDPEPTSEVRLTFEGRRPANPWAVFGGSPMPAGNAQRGGRISDGPANGSLAARPRLTGIEAAAVAKCRPAANRGAGQAQSWWYESNTRVVLLVLAVIGGAILLMVTGHGDEIPWLARR